MTDTLPSSESLTVEFKSDRKCLSDDDLIETVVCLANTDGGTIFLGVEDDGAPTGLHANHQPPHGLAALVANRTMPSVQVGVDTLTVSGHEIARITVPKAVQIVATTRGVVKRRRVMPDGRPECIPFLPHEMPTRLADLGQHDATRQLVANATIADLDDAERARLRQFVERNQSDSSLLALTDAELDGALGLTQGNGDARRPTLTGLLLIGKEGVLHSEGERRWRKYVPGPALPIHLK
jgi:ATP-dependent DNA helicase RecG